MKRLTGLMSATLLLICSSAVAAGDPSILGCWRGQQIQTTLSDGGLRQQNGNCVGYYDESSYRSYCMNDSGITESLSQYEVPSSGVLKLTPLDPLTKAPKGPTAEISYRVDDKWLLIDRQFERQTTAAPNSKQVVRFQSVSIRLPTGSVDESKCRPTSKSGLRIGRTPTSSLDMKVPNGWQPWLVDPAADEKLGPAVNANLFVGAFVPDTTDAKSNSPVNLLLVLDDTRYGPTVTRASEFIKVKKRFASELSSDIKLICDLPDKSCALLKTPDGGQVYMEIFNVKGRVATVSATSTSASSSASEALRKAVQLFVEELRASNEN